MASRAKQSYGESMQLWSPLRRYVARMTADWRRSLLPSLASACWIAGAIWRYRYILIDHPMTSFVYSDMATYNYAAVHFLDPHFVPSIGDAFYPPGAGYFFAALFRIDPTWQVAKWVMFGLSCAAPLLIGWSAWMLFDVLVASLCVAILSLYFPWIDYFAFFLSEGPFIITNAIALALLIAALRRCGNDGKGVRVIVALAAIGAGVMFGAAAAVKAQALAWYVLLTILLLFWRVVHRARGLFPVVAFMGLGIAPLLFALEHRCTKVNDGTRCLISTNGPMAMLHGHIARVRTTNWHDPVRNYTYSFTSPVAAQLTMHDRDISFEFGVYDTKAIMARMVEQVRTHPLETIALSFDQIFMMFDTVPWPASHTNWYRAMVVSQQLFVVVMLFPGVLHLRSRWRALTLDPTFASELILLAILIGLTGSCALTQGDPRYRIPLDGFVAILASAEILRWFGGEPRSRLALRRGLTKPPALPA